MQDMIIDKDNELCPQANQTKNLYVMQSLNIFYKRFDSKKRPSDLCSAESKLPLSPNASHISTLSFHNCPKFDKMAYVVPCCQKVYKVKV